MQSYQYIVLVYLAGETVYHGPFIDEDSARQWAKDNWMNYVRDIKPLEEV